LTELKPPHITGNTEKERLEQVIRYLFQLTKELNLALRQLEQERR
jgi:hypothetical protein